MSTNNNTETPVATGLLNITLPGDLPGLLRRGSPCIFACDDAGRHSAGDECIVVASGGDGVLVATNRRVFVEVNAAALALDLTDVTGRAHARLWVVEQLMCRGSLNSPFSTPTSMVERLVWKVIDARFYEDDPPASALQAHIGTWCHCWSTGPLAHDDDTRLPDGSRWVDAEALRRAVMRMRAFC